MAAGIILAGGAGTRMPGDKAFMEVAGRRVIDTELEVIEGLFERVLIVVNAGRVGQFDSYRSAGIHVVEEPVRGKGPLGGILSGLMLSGVEENFVLACDMPFIRREAIRYVMDSLPGFEVAVPRAPDGLEPLHAAYRSSCRRAIEEQLAAGSLKVTGFYDRVKLKEIPWEELERFDSTGRMLLNINSPEDMKRAAGVDSSVDAPRDEPG